MDKVEIVIVTDRETYERLVERLDALLQEYDVACRVRAG